ncbi:MAG: MFS transporter [Erysipelothrix sp.]|nr:MFS transporter [Erysipelothrix sp.]
MKMNKQEKSWVLYDVANSAFVLILTATIPIFFGSLIKAEGVEGVINNPLVKLFFAKNAQAAMIGGVDSQAFAALQTGLFGLSTSVSVFVTALTAPILGSIADIKGMKKKLFSIFLLIGLIGVLFLGVTTKWTAFLFLIIISRIGFSGANVFYDSMLVDVSDDENMDYVSSAGYAFGYIGSIIPFIVGIYLILALPFGLEITRATQISFLITAVWWALLSLPLLKNVKQTHYSDQTLIDKKNVFKGLAITLNKIKADKRIFYFIIAYFCYIDGVYTIISMATTYGAEVGIGDNQMIIALLVTQIVAFPFAILSGRLAMKYHSLNLIRFYIVMYIGIAFLGFIMQYAWQFWLLAIAVGMAQGGIQSLSRSYFGQIIPKNESNEFFGFFDIFGKFADFFGPLILAFSAASFGHSKYGILLLNVLFIIGFILVGKVLALEKDL